MTVAGASMRPTVHPTDIVFVRRAPSYRPGDVVLMDSAGELLLHRLVGRIDASRYTHAGDAAPWCGVVSSRQILGRAENAPRKTPSLPTRAAARALQLGAFLAHLGIPIPLLKLFKRPLA